MNRKRIGAGLAAVVAAGGIAACGHNAGNQAQQIEQKQQNQDSLSLDLAQPLPHYNYSQIRQNLKEIETAQAEGVQSTTFFFNQGVRDPVQSCPSIGAPIPTTDQLSNPNKLVRDPNGGNVPGSDVVGQEDPTGVYSGGSSGTYVMCVGANGKAYADYWEGFVQTVFGAATWDEGAHQVQLTGPPSFNFSGGK